MPHPNLAFFDRDKSYWYVLSAFPLLSGEAEDVVQPLGSPLLFLYAILVESRHWWCSDMDPERPSFSVPSNFPAPCPYPSAQGCFPVLSLPRGLAHHFHSVPWHKLCVDTGCPSLLLPIQGAGVIISCLSAFLILCLTALFSADGWNLQFGFTSACWKSC